MKEYQCRRSRQGWEGVEGTGGAKLSLGVQVTGRCSWNVLTPTGFQMSEVLLESTSPPRRTFKRLSRPKGSTEVILRRPNSSRSRTVGKRVKGRASLRKI